MPSISSTGLTGAFVRQCRKASGSLSVVLGPWSVVSLTTDHGLRTTDVAPKLFCSVSAPCFLRLGVLFFNVRDFLLTRLLVVSLFRAIQAQAVLIG